MCAGGLQGWLPPQAQPRVGRGSQLVLARPTPNVNALQSTSDAKQGAARARSLTKAVMGALRVLSSARRLDKGLRGPKQ